MNAVRNFFLSFHNQRLKILGLASINMYVVSLIIAKLDTRFELRWVVVWIYIFSIMAVMVLYVKNIKRSSLNKIILNRHDLSIILIILCLSLFVGFLFIGSYPFVSSGDELRDAGLNAMRIVNGQTTRLFGTGDYNGYGNIVPLISSLFYRIFDGSFLSYKVPATFVMVADTLLFYILLRIHFKRRLSFLGTLIYLTLPHHLFFARTELLIALDSFWTVALFFSFSVLLRKRNIPSYIFFGTLLGIVSQFHTALRIVVISLFLMVLFYDFIIDKKETIRVKISRIVLVIVFFFVGFGPMILFTNKDNILQKQRFAYRGTKISIWEKASLIKKNYIKSVMAIGYEATMSRYPEHKPLFPPFLFLLLVIGMGYCFFYIKDYLYRCLLVLVFIIPFFNSAITDWLNADHRLVSLLPLGTFFIVLGIFWIMGLFKKHKLISAGIFLGICMYAVVLGATFFTSFDAAKGRDIKDYLTMHIIYFLKSHPFKSKEICIGVSKENFKNLDYTQYRQAFEYFVPELTIDRKVIKALTGSEAYITPGSCKKMSKPKRVKVVKCNGVNNVYCPVGYKGKITIYY